MSPRVTFGLAVRNGAPALAGALESLVAQDEPDLEILVSDNASTDDTPDIIESYRARDRRIRAFRHDVTLRALEHFHWIKDQARSEYFAWAAHDDSRSPDFASSLLRALDRRPEAVLAFGDLRASSVPCGRGEPLPFDFATEGMGRAARVRKAAFRECYHVYGLWRLDALKRIPVTVTAWWPDLPIMTAAACLGEFVHVPGPEFHYFRVIKSNEQRAAYQDPGVRFGRVAQMIELERATWRACSAVAGPLTGAFAAGCVGLRFALDLPGFVARRVRERLPAAARR